MAPTLANAGSTCKSVPDQVPIVRGKSARACRGGRAVDVKHIALTAHPPPWIKVTQATASQT